MHYDDSLLGQVLDDLERRKLLDRTIVIVTSDHGIEFDENRLGFKGHGTAYSEYQMRTPLVVRWPGRPPGKVTRRTSHNDIAPTLLTELFGCANPPSDYASGSSLFSDAQWSWLVVASYREYAVVEPERVTVVFPAGYEVRGPDYRLARTQSAAPRRAARRDAGDEPVLSLRAGPLGVLLLGAMCAAAAPVSAEQAGSGIVRVVGDRLNLVIALEGAAPVEWRACHPSCTNADAGTGTAVWLIGAGDPAIRLVVRDLDPPLDLQGLVSVSLTEDESARASRPSRPTCRCPASRLVKIVEVSHNGYEVVMTERMIGPNAAAFMSGRRLTLELGAVRGLAPPPAADRHDARADDSIIVTGRVRTVRDDRREPNRRSAPATGSDSTVASGRCSFAR